MPEKATCNTLGCRPHPKHSTAEEGRWSSVWLPPDTAQWVACSVSRQLVIATGLSVEEYGVLLLLPCPPYTWPSECELGWEA